MMCSVLNLLIFIILSVCFISGGRLFLNCFIPEFGDSDEFMLLSEKDHFESLQEFPMLKNVTVPHITP